MEIIKKHRLWIGIAVVLGGALLAPTMGQTRERSQGRTEVLRAANFYRVDEAPGADGIDDLTEEEAGASCSPGCAPGYECKNGQCQRRPIIINCPNNEPLCGIED